MENNLYVMLFFCLFFQSCKGQIVKDTTIDQTVENIKKQPYLNNRVNCDEEQSDLLTNRICLNFAFQKADSIMRLTLDSLLVEVSEYEDDSLGIRVLKMQETWRNLRDEHCGICMI